MGEAGKDELVDRFKTYEIGAEDLQYLGEAELARTIVELGYRSSGTLSRDRFFQAKAELEAARNINKQESPTEGKETGEDRKKEDPMVTALKYRFPINLSGSMHSLLYASAVRKSGDEVSGFIDLASRVRQESFLPYLTGQRRLRPKPGDLTYANISRRKSKLCSSGIWKVCVGESVEFEHRDTGITISTAGILAGERQGWTEVETGDSTQKLLCFDLEVSPANAPNG